jgi:plastocyanin
MKLSELKISFLSFSLLLLAKSCYGADHKVVVGLNGQLQFEPYNFDASPGDTVTFEFHQKNHSGEFQNTPVHTSIDH